MGIEKSLEFRMKPVKYQLWITPRNLRFETEGGKLKGKVILYKKSQKKFFLLDSQKKAFLEITQKEILELRNQLKIMKANFEKKMKDASALERKMLESMMGQVLKAREAAKTAQMTYKKLDGQEHQVKSWPCERSEGYMLGVKVNEICIASWKTLGLKRTDLQVAFDMIQFIEEFVTDVGVMDPEDFYKFGAADWKGGGTRSKGFPVQVNAVKRGEVIRTTRVEKIQNLRIPDSQFSIPKDYKNKQISWEDFKFRLQ